MSKQNSMRAGNTNGLVKIGMKINSKRVNDMGELKSKVRYIVHKYMNNELVDDEFKEQIKWIINEFEGKIPEKLLYQDIGLIVLEREKSSQTVSDKLKKIWMLLDEVKPEIKRALENWKKSMSK